MMVGRSGPIHRSLGGAVLSITLDEKPVVIKRCYNTSCMLIYETKFIK